MNVETMARRPSSGKASAVTNLQMVMATAAIANGGRLMEPVLVHRVNGAGGEPVREAAPRGAAAGGVAGVARTVAEMMIAVTEGHGTGVQAGGRRLQRRRQRRAPRRRRSRGGYSLENHTASVWVSFQRASRYWR